MPSKYIQNNLFDNEEVIFVTSYHWKIFISLGSIITLFIKPAYKKFTTEFVITDSRIISKKDWLSPDTWEIGTDQIETINVDRNLLGRMLGFGTVTIIGNGGTKKVFHDIAKPLTFRKKFQESNF